MLQAPVQGVLVRQTRIHRPRDQEVPQAGDCVQVLLSEEISGVIGDVVVGQAASSLVRPRQHRRGEISLRLHVEQGPEVEEVQEILELRVLPSD